MDVGLPEGQMGNSEVGHLNLGAGRVVYQDLDPDQQGDPRRVSCRPYPRMPHAAFESAARGHRLTLVIGLLSDGGVQQSPGPSGCTWSNT